VEGSSGITKARQSRLNITRGGPVHRDLAVKPAEASLKSGGEQPNAVHLEEKNLYGKEKGDARNVLSTKN